ncbi:HAD family hydrolase [Rubrivirga sp.]|uniref:HAD family hydrolase n=1 Tax=Rubrivirga sp. TaxID=1885344 RepID=UPI003B52BC10
MLDLLAFDLDGTLADTETLKAESYAWAAHRLRPDIDPADVEDAYTDCVGLSRQEIATSLLHRFDLEDAARAHDGSVEPWESYVALRLDRYRERLADGDLVRAHARPHAISLVRGAGSLARVLALVTTSGARNAGLVLGALGLTDAFDTVVTADDVAETKPDPEGYRLALSRLSANAARSLVVEDSPAGVQGALAAGLPVLAVPDALTRDGIDALVADGALPASSVVAPADLAATVRQRAAGVG